MSSENNFIVDPSFAATKTVWIGNAANGVEAVESVARSVYFDAVEKGRTPVMVEVHIRVAPQEAA